MELRLKRIARKDGYTIGKLYTDGGKYLCDTLEDTDRHLKKSTPLSVIKAVKIKGKTAIPTGRYKMDCKVKSGRFSNPKYKWSTKVGALLPRLYDVPGWEGVLIHVGNTAADTEGCLLVGENRTVGCVVNSIATFERLYPLFKQCTHITIE